MLKAINCCQYFGIRDTLKPIDASPALPAGDRHHLWPRLNGTESTLQVVVVMQKFIKLLFPSLLARAEYDDGTSSRANFPFNSNFVCVTGNGGKFRRIARCQHNPHYACIKYKIVFDLYWY
ncbi:hypothetical protein AAMO2058_001688000 [Amorphochlora amoebiformis]